MSCPHCSNKLTNEEFKAKFKVGDTITGWSSNKRVILTAIGEKRFLYVSDNGAESVASTSSITNKWRHI